MEVPTNPTRESAFVWICGSFLISANEIRISREDFFGSGTETHGRSIIPVSKVLTEIISDSNEGREFCKARRVGPRSCW